MTKFKRPPKAPQSTTVRPDLVRAVHDVLIKEHNTHGRMLTTQQIAKLSGVSTGTIYKIVRLGLMADFAEAATVTERMPNGTVRLITAWRIRTQRPLSKRAQRAEKEVGRFASADDFL